VADRERDSETRDSETDETIVEHVETAGQTPDPPPGAPLGTPEVEEAVVRESETIRQRPDGAIERDVVRHEQRRRMSGDRIALLLVLLGLLLAAGLGAWWYFTQDDTTSVPSVEGLTVDRAVARLQEEDLRADIVTQPSEAPEGTVFDQNPGAGAEVDEDSTVQVLVSGGPGTKAVPNAVGLPEAEARDRLVSAGFQVRTREVFSEKAEGTVVAQEPAAGAQGDEGGEVTINVSKGSAQVEVPSVVGLDRDEAEAEIESANLRANVVVVPSVEPEGTVVAQNPTGGTLREGSTVRLNVSAGSSTTEPTPTTTDTTNDTTTTP
jgi:eukaryotic-like serine/threonine-protein kinase